MAARSGSGTFLVPLLLWSVSWALSACESSAGLGEKCGEDGHATIACEADLYCARAELNHPLGVCAARGAEGAPCPDTTVESCARGLTCNVYVMPAVCARPVGAGGDCAQAPCAGGLICLKVGAAATCQPRQQAGQPCAANGDCSDGLSCLPAAAGTPGAVCGRHRGPDGLCDDLADCDVTLVCNAGYSPARCKARGGAGEPCTRPQDCQSGTCATATNTCAAP